MFHVNTIPRNLTKKEKEREREREGGGGGGEAERTCPDRQKGTVNDG